MPNHATRHCNILLYADHTVLFSSGTDIATIEKKINDEMNLVDSWLRDNSLFLNAGKTESMLFGTCANLKNVNYFNIHVNGCTINRVSEFKYLGVTFDENVNWNAHVKYVITKAGKRIGMLSRIRNNITVYCANIIYTSFIRPIFDYCDNIYHCCGEVNSQSLEKMQGRAARVVCKSYDSDTAMISLKWGTLIRRLEHHILVLSKSVSVVVADNFM